MKNITKLFLFLNGIGIIVFFVLSKYDDPQWGIVSLNLSVFFMVWIIVLILRPQEPVKLRSKHY